ncbi:MAG TPA: hypothetical protein PK251_06235 [Candidatus Latescibacteria bacterium]|nr:hypothetical protein [Candidatus Latescibacterota bacterium]HOS64342.1 hypothetical protein [Candidatus Latescibacterota bacterium]HPK75759.1 hypothetical protein [Candidatus Latescibacterota bacterium]
MARYEYGRIARLADSLAQAGIDEAVCAEISRGGESIRSSTPPAKKAEWMRGAMERMNALIEPEIRHCVREASACCLGGKRLECSKAIAKNHLTLEDRIRAANETRFVFGHSVTLQEDGRVLVRFAPEGLPGYRCVCLPQAGEPISETYCYCCGGHVKHHLQIALGRTLRCTVRSSALASGGREACTFLLDFAD